MHLAFVCNPKYPIQPLLDQLNQQKIVFNIQEQNGEKLLFVEDEKWIQPVTYFYLQLCHQQDHRFSLSNLKKTPVTAFLIIFSILVAVITQLGEQFTPWFFIADIQYYPRGWQFFDGSWQLLWRSFSPIFLHFSPEHLIFNCLMIWYLGSLIERQVGSVFFVVLVMLLAAISNYAQLFDSGPLFGGLSGVAYGLVVFAYGYQRWTRHLFIPNGLFIVAFVWMLVGMTQLLSLIGLGKIANLAHVSGAVAGGLVYGFYRFSSVLRNRHEN